MGLDGILMDFDGFWWVLVGFDEFWWDFDGPALQGTHDSPFMPKTVRPDSFFQLLLMKNFWF